MAAALQMNAEIDTSHILPSIRTPTLVLHRIDDTRIPVDVGREIARRVPGAKMITLPGNDHIFINEPELMERIAGDVEEFLILIRRRRGAAD